MSHGQSGPPSTFWLCPRLVSSRWTAQHLHGELSRMWWKTASSSMSRGDAGSGGPVVSQRRLRSTAQVCLSMAMCATCGGSSELRAPPPATVSRDAGLLGMTHDMAYSLRYALGPAPCGPRGHLSQTSVLQRAASADPRVVRRRRHASRARQPSPPGVVQTRPVEGRHGIACHAR